MKSDVAAGDRAAEDGGAEGPGLIEKQLGRYRRLYRHAEAEQHQAGLVRDFHAPIYATGDEGRVFFENQAEQTDRGFTGAVSIGGLDPVELCVGLLDREPLDGRSIGITDDEGPRPRLR